MNREFQVTPNLEIQSDESVLLTLTCELSEKSLLQLIDKSKAEYAVEVHCRKTYVRHLLSRKNKQFSFKFPRGTLHERVEISAYIVCTDNVTGHTSTALHPEFGKNAKFNFVPGDVLARMYPTVYWVEPEFAKKIGSIFELHPSDKIPRGSFSIGWDEPKVQILMHSTDAAKFKGLQSSQHMLPYLLASVCLIAVTETLRIMVLEENAYSEKKWFHVISHKINEKGIKLKENTTFSELAQELLDFPVGRILFSEGS